MNTIGYLGILYLIVLVVPTLVVNRYLEIRMNKQIAIAIVRMIIQLSLVGFYLQFIFELDSAVLNIAYLLVMMLVATISVTNSTNLKLRKLYPSLYISMVVPNLVMVLIFNQLVIGLSDVLEARYVITIGGMLLGNVLNGDIIGLTAFYKGISENRKRVNYDLALGATRFQALKPYLKDAITTSIRPTVASMATIGLVALPGMMTGQILGGSVPVEAIMYQIAIMIAIYVTRYVNILGAVVLTQNKLFDKRDQLIISL